MMQEGLTFKLFVTGHSEQDALHLMFKSLSFNGPFNFIKGQRIVYLPKSPKTKQKRTTNESKSQKVTQTSQILAPNDEFIALRVRGELQAAQNILVIIIDDLEYDRKDKATELFSSYRNAIETVVPDIQMRRRVSIHFLVMMLEAYYFADVQAINKALGTNIPRDYAGDVESIRNPYSEIKQIFRNFDKREDGAKIIPRLNIEHILSNPKTCASLRTLFAWCVEAILDFYPEFQNEFPNYHLEDGIQYAVTNGQLSILRRNSYE